jgi:hypothetical protein
MRSPNHSPKSTARSPNHHPHDNAIAQPLTQKAQRDRLLVLSSKIHNPLPITCAFGYVVLIVGQTEIEDF